MQKKLKNNIKDFLFSDELYQKHEIKKLRIFLWGVCIFLALISGWNAKYSIFPDGICYLDLGDAFFSGDFKTAVNSYWSPMYGILIGSGVNLFNLRMENEIYFVKFINILILIFTLFSFDYLLRTLIRFNKESETEKNLPLWFVYLVSYSLFIFIVIKLIGVNLTTPDMAVAALIFLVAVYLIQIKNAEASHATFLKLGIVLGVGYLFKLLMLSVAILTFAYLFLFLKSEKYKQLKITSLIVFLVISLPFIIAVSIKKERLTFGDTGKLNYAWHVNGITKYIHWRGECPWEKVTWNPRNQDDDEDSLIVKKKRNIRRKYCPEFGKPIHPAEKIFDNPTVFKFDKPIKGTYPVWFDPTYWFEGINVRLDLEAHLRNIANNTWFLKKYVFDLSKGGAFLVIIFMLFYLGGQNINSFKDSLNRHRFLIIPSVLMILFHMAVHIEPRYVASFLLLLLLVFFFSLKIESSRETARLLKFATIISLLFLTNLVYKEVNFFVKQSKHPKKSQSIVCAKQLKKMGYKDGDKIANIGNSIFSLWARLARLQIITEIPVRGKHGTNFWKQPLSKRADIIATFVESGAKAIVVYNPPRKIIANKKEWSHVHGTKFYVYDLRQFQEYLKE